VSNTKCRGRKIHVFAYDTVLYSSHPDLTFAALRTQIAINELTVNAIILNATLTSHNSPTPIVSTFKLLGITLDSRLNWKDHIDDLLKNVSPYINLLKMLSSIHWRGDPAIMNMLYKLVIRSKLEYASPLYRSASRSQLQN